MVEFTQTLSGLEKAACIAPMMITFTFVIVSLHPTLLMVIRLTVKLPVVL